MAIYHLTATVISRARGQRVVAAAAARAGARIFDEAYGVTHNHSQVPGVTHTEILVPPGAPPWTLDRAALWNRVEAGEKRKDSQLARQIEISLPAELNAEQNIALLRDFATAEFVAKGMIADVSMRRSNTAAPQAHILLTLREPTATGFGPKMRQWNRKNNLLDWRSAWAACANRHLARAGHAARIDHRTLDAQQIDLAPTRRIGIGAAQAAERRLPAHLEARIDDRRRIATENGEAIRNDPTIAIRALAQQRSTFTREEMTQFLRSRTGDAAQRAAALEAVMNCGELVALPELGTHGARYTSRDLLDAEKSLLRRAGVMISRRGHAVAREPTAPPDADLDYVLGAGDFAAIAQSEMEQHSQLLDTATRSWTAAGFTVIFAVPEAGPTPQNIVIVRGAEMIELKPLEKLLAAVDRARAKIVLIGNAQQLEAMGNLSPLSALIGLGRA